MEELIRIISYNDRADLQELYDLDGVVQDSIHHPEGDALVHTLHVVDAMDDIIARENDALAYGSFAYYVLIYAALTHDFGKASTTVVHEDGRITAYGHPKAGIEPANNFLTRIGVDYRIIEHVLPLVAEHMAWVGFYTPEVTRKAIRRLARRLHPTTIEMWALVVEADISGRPPLPKGLPQKAADMLLLARQMGLNQGYRENL